MPRSDTQDNKVRGVTQDTTQYSKTGYDLIGQWANWENLLDMANAVRYRFSQYRLPMPGESIDVTEAQARVKNIDKEWSKEHDLRGDDNEKPCPEFQNCSIETQCYLHSILVSSEAEPANDNWMFGW